MKNEKKKEKKTNPNAFLTARDIYLRALEVSDAAAFTRFLNDRDMTLNLAWNGAITLEAEEKILREVGNDRETIRFAICDSTTHETLGVVGAHHVDYKHGVCDTGMFIGVKNKRGKGIGTQAKMLFLYHLFNDLGLRRVESTTYDFNIASQKCLVKCGYEKEGVKKESKFRDGAYVDEFTFAILAKNFFPLWEKFVSEYGITVAVRRPR
jgi:RimJ/RimL family protein N-acetyltransferase